jgi:hypothetical protein
MTTQRAVTLPTETGNGDNYEDETSYDARGPRDDGTSKVPDRGLKIRRV